MRNLAFIDGQNLYLGTTKEQWQINYARLRIYLKEKYQVVEAYYFFGYISEYQKGLYTNLQQSGFTILFKEHDKRLLAKKKGNVDTDIVFEAMKHLVDDNSFEKILLISGDGDYKKLIDYLISKNKFKKILFPNKKFVSSLYKKLGSEYFDYLSNIRSYIEYKPEKGS